MCLVRIAAGRNVLMIKQAWIIILYQWLNKLCRQRWAPTAATSALHENNCLMARPYIQRAKARSTSNLSLAAQSFKAFLRICRNHDQMIFFTIYRFIKFFSSDIDFRQISSSELILLSSMMFSSIFVPKWRTFLMIIMPPSTTISWKGIQPMNTLSTG